MTADRLTVRQAARVTGVPRTTLTRALQAGRIPGAVRTGNGWDVPAEGLEAAGYPVDLGLLADPGNGTAPTPAADVAALRDRVAELEAEAKARAAEVNELTTRAAVAEAIAAERAERITDLQRNVDGLHLQLAVAQQKPRRREALEAVAVDRPTTSETTEPDPPTRRRWGFRRADRR